MTRFQADLLSWYDQWNRDLPWRDSTDPYPVLVSEVMLQQTTVAAVIPYFTRWMNRFPDIESLARAEPAELDQLWAGLGYYSRCRRLHSVAKKVVEFGWPKDEQGLGALPGFGPYTVAAVGSIAFGWPLACVDGNVERVYSRIIVDPAVGPSLKKAAQVWADSVLERSRPGDWNQALMELGATICRPKDPQCRTCPVKAHCRAFQEDRVSEFPSPKPKTKWINVEQVMTIPVCGTAVGLRQFAAGEWWAGLWGFARSANSQPDAMRIGTINHVVTRHKVSVSIELQLTSDKTPDLTWCEIKDVAVRFALPVPDQKALGLVSARLGLSTGQPTLFESQRDNVVQNQEKNAV